MNFLPLIFFFLGDAEAALDFMVVVVLLTANQMAMDLLNQLRVAMAVLLVVEASEVVEAIVETSNARVLVGMMIVMQNGLGTRSFIVANVLP
jgi:hypothetical protein